MGYKNPAKCGQEPDRQLFNAILRQAVTGHNIDQVAQRVESIPVKPRFQDDAFGSRSRRHYWWGGQDESAEDPRFGNPHKQTRRALRGTARFEQQRKRREGAKRKQWNFPPTTPQD